MIKCKKVNNNIATIPLLSSNNKFSSSRQMLGDFILKVDRKYSLTQMKISSTPLISKPFFT